MPTASRRSRPHGSMPSATTPASASPTLTVDRHGRHVAAGHHAAVPGPRFCSVMSWVHGKIVRERFDHTIAHGMGVVLAGLHEHAADYVPPSIPPGIVANRVVYFGDTSRLANYESTYGSMFVEAIDRVQIQIDELWRSPPHRPHLLHGDFGPQNVMRHRTRLTPIDFQDLQFGFELQDVAITVNDLRRLYNDESLIDAIKSGYRTARPWPLDDEALERTLGAGAQPQRDQPRIEPATPGPARVHRSACLAGRRLDGGLGTNSSVDLNLGRGHALPTPVVPDTRDDRRHEHRPVRRLAQRPRHRAVRLVRRSVAMVGRRRRRILGGTVGVCRGAVQRAVLRGAQQRRRCRAARGSSAHD